MRTIVWFGAFVVGLILEVSVLPTWIGGLTPPIASATFLVALAALNFWPGFLFAGLAGFVRDVVTANASAVHTTASLAVFFAVAAFGALTQWEEPLRRIGALITGLLAAVPAMFLGIAVNRVFFGAASPIPAVGDAASQPMILAFVFHTLWLSAYSWFLIRAARHLRARRLEHL